MERAHSFGVKRGRSGVTDQSTPAELSQWLQTLLPAKMSIPHVSGADVLACASCEVRAVYELRAVEPTPAVAALPLLSTLFEGIDAYKRIDGNTKKIQGCCRAIPLSSTCVWQAGVRSCC